MSDGGSHSNGRGTVEQQLGDVRDRLSYVEAGLPRIEQVQGELIKTEARLRAVANELTAGSDRTNHLASATAHRFEQLGGRFDLMLTEQAAQLARLTILVNALTRKAKRRARR